MADNRNASLSDMLRSIIVIGVMILGLAGVGYWFQIRPDSTVKSVDYLSAVKDARADAAFEVYAPPSLPQGWKATTVRYQAGEPGAWHLGVLTDDEEYIGLEQTGLGTQRALEKFSPETEGEGKTDVGGFAWQLRQSDGGETTLVRDEADMTIIVTGTAGREAIEDYTASLTTG